MTDTKITDSNALLVGTCVECGGETAEYYCRGCGMQGITCLDKDCNLSIFNRHPRHRKSVFIRNQDTLQEETIPEKHYSTVNYGNGVPVDITLNDTNKAQLFLLSRKGNGSISDIANKLLAVSLQRVFAGTEEIA